MQHRSLAIAISTLLFAASCTANRDVPAVSDSAPQAVHVRGASMPVVALRAKTSGPAVGVDLYGASLDTWYDFSQSFVNPSLRKTGIHLVRWPGGSESDAYHWENGGTLCDSMGYITPGDTFSNFMKHVAGPLNIDIAITLNYGSNPACNGGGEPSEAAAWATFAKNNGYRVTYWTVGNEVYGSWEYDLHAHPHDPVTYSNAVRTGYYPAMKKADPNAKVGVVVDLPSDTAWNDVVLRKAKPFDFVELHYYPEYNDDNDKLLLGEYVDNFASDLSGLRKQMDAAGVSKSTPIYLGEFNNDAGNEGKQSVSIVNGLYLGQIAGTLADAGVPMATWWLAYGSCDQDGDSTDGIYGFQNFGSEALFSDGLPDPYEGCSTTPTIPGGTPFPTARVMALLAKGVPSGSQVRQVSVPQSLGDNVRAYGFALSNGGYAFVIYNNTLSSIQLDAKLEGAGSKFTGTLTVYGSVQYDKSKNNHWVGPVTQSLGTVGATVPLTLQAYSVSLLTMN